jgi:hypothetical protein
MEKIGLRSRQASKVLSREYSRERTRYLSVVHVLLLLTRRQQTAPLISWSPSSWLSKVGLNIVVPLYFTPVWLSGPFTEFHWAGG